MAAAAELHIIAPGICGPLAETRSIENNPDVKNWSRVLSRSDHSESFSNIDEAMTALFDLSIDGDFPSAALSMLAQDRYETSSNVMFADPVHMQADMDHAVLTSSEDLDISEQEAEAFCAMLNQHFNQDGLHFIRLHKDQWLVSSEQEIRISTTSLSSAIGRNVNFILPKGEAAGQWKQVLTEAQMLLHVHGTNESRENAGKQSINSLWFHGSGELPAFKNCRVDSICSNTGLFKGLAAHVQCEYLPLAESVSDYVCGLPDDGAVNVLHLCDLEHLVNYTDVSIWSEKLTQVLERWIYPLLTMANKNNINISLYPCNGKQYRFSKRDGLKFWRRDSLQQHITNY